MPQSDHLTARVRHRDMNVSIIATGKRSQLTLVLVVLILALAAIAWAIEPRRMPQLADAESAGGPTACP